MTMNTSSPTTDSTTTAPSVSQIERFVEHLIQDLAPVPAAPGPGRPPILPALALWGGVLVCVLRGATSQLAIWRLLTLEGLWSYPRVSLTDQAIYNRLDVATLPLETLFRQVRDALRVRLTPFTATTLAPFATEIYALDQTCLDPVARVLAPLRSLKKRDKRLLPGRLDALFDVRRQLWQRITYTADPVQNEKVGARDLVSSLPAGTLLLFDLGYFAFRWFDELTDAGIFWLSRAKSNLSYEVLHTFYADPKHEHFDGLIVLGAHRADHAKHAVRLVQYRRGTVLHRYLTNVTDPQRFPPTMMAQTYARRWDIEMGMQLIKEHLGVRGLWSAKPQVILQQVWAVLIIAQILQALRAEIASRAGVDLFEVSMPLLVDYAPKLLAGGRDPVAVFVEEGRRVGFIRPSRRTRYDAFTIPPDRLIPLPPDLVTERVPRYGHRHRPPRKGIPKYGDWN